MYGAQVIAVELFIGDSGLIIIDEMGTIENQSVVVSVEGLGEARGEGAA